MPCGTRILRHPLFKADNPHYTSTPHGPDRAAGARNPQQSMQSLKIQILAVLPIFMQDEE
jgi:hypothetical protein